MKKCLLVLLIFVVIGGTAFAFDIMSHPPRLAGGNAVMIDAGVGLNTDILFWSVLFAGYGKMSVIPLYLNVEYALPSIPLSIGLSASYYQMKWNLYDSWDWGWEFNYLTIASRINWHWGFNVKWMDFYTGLSLGYRAFWDTWYGNSYYHYSYTSSYGGFYYGAQVGIHFYFTNFLGLQLETGYPYLLKAGLSFKIGGGKGGNKAKSSSSSSSQSKSKYMVVNSDTLNVRSGPSADKPVVVVLKRKDRVEVLDKSSGSWWRIKAGKVEGYVNSSYLAEE